MIATADGVVDLEDAQISSVERTGNEIDISFKRVKIRPPSGDARTVENVLLRLTGVSLERSAYYVGENIQAPHPDPSFPLDSVEMFEFADNTLKLQGYRDRKPWYVWEITADSVLVEMPGVMGDA